MLDSLRPRHMGGRHAPPRKGRGAGATSLTEGLELYEIICELHRRCLTLFDRRGGHIQTAREREMFRLRAVEGLP
jgi:hypothetical protein